MSEADQENASAAVDSATGRENTLSEFANVAVNYLTGGLVSYEDGKLGKGYLTRGLDESVGEISGRNMQRKAQMEAKDAIAEEKKAKGQELKEEQAKKQRDDISASTGAAAIRASSVSKSKSLLGSPEKDFLGL